jgi:hypothetical protein
MTRIDAILLLVGRLNYTWTNTESLLIYLISFLMNTSKEAAIVVFLTLNTTRARIDLIERLSKIAATPAPVRNNILDLMARLKAESRLRNKYNHCIYSFDETGKSGSTQLMRIAEFNEDVRYGKVEQIDDAEIERIKAAIGEITSVNKQMWSLIKSHNIAV